MGDSPTGAAVGSAGLADPGCGASALADGVADHRGDGVASAGVARVVAAGEAQAAPTTARSAIAVRTLRVAVGTIIVPRRACSSHASDALTEDLLRCDRHVSRR
jgi:hypothetical protein